MGKELKATKRKIEEICDDLESYSEWSTRIYISYLQVILWENIILMILLVAFKNAI